MKSLGFLVPFCAVAAICFFGAMAQSNLPMREYLSGDLRCDLRPRWNRTGDAICFDALETRTWTRQLHVAFLDFK